MIVKCIKNKREDLSAELLPNYDRPDEKGNG
jgi:hypothetical protein